MKAITKLTAVALSAMSIAGGVALAQTASSDEDGRAQTANYGTPPGAPLKRDGSLSADPVVKTTVTPVTTDSSSTTTTTTQTTTYDNPPAAAPVAEAPAASPAPDTSASTTAVDNTPAPRADRN
jgi:hypothetical protein